MAPLITYLFVCMRDGIFQEIHRHYFIIYMYKVSSKYARLDNWFYQINVAYFIVMKNDYLHVMSYLFSAEALKEKGREKAT